MTDEEFQFLARKLQDLTGIFLGDEKKVMLSSRISKRMSQLGIENFTQYIHELSGNPAEVSDFINALTTNKTDWFREPSHFEYLSSWVEKTRRKRGPDELFYLWSAACSTGEEVYSLFMTLDMLLPGDGFRILGSDIDTEVLANAEAGCYPEDQLRRQVPPEYISRYFQRFGDRSSVTLQIRPECRSKIKFRQFNLIQGDLGSKICFDVIFLRNVLIYFKRETVELIVRRLLSYLKSGGLLIVGHAESLNGISIPVERVGDAVYTKVR